MKKLDLSNLRWKINEQLEELMEYTCLKLDDAGLVDVTPETVVDTNHTYEIPGRTAKYGLYFSGENLIVSVVNRFNGSKENISLRIDCMCWQNSSGFAKHSVKFSYKDSKKKIDRLIDEIIKKYKEEI